MKDSGIDLHVDVQDEIDRTEYTSILNFLPPDTFRQIVEQQPPDVSNVQKWAVDLSVNMNQQILYLCGKAGPGKMQVALKICEMFAGRVQAAAVTGKAPSLLGAPTVHGMFWWGTYDQSQPDGTPAMSSRKVTELQSFYDGIEVFVIDEVNAMSALLLAQLHETMTKVFNPNLQKTGGNVLPFGGKKMVFLGDPAQLERVMGKPTYGGGTPSTEGMLKAVRARGARGR